MGETLVDMAVEMADAIFVPERLERLVADLRDYRRSLDRAGERQAAAQVQTVLILLDREDVAPGENMFLAGLCFVALREVFAAMRETSAAHAEPPGEGQQQNEEVPR
jgi:hypothetical protein